MERRASSGGSPPHGRRPAPPAWDPGWRREHAGMAPVMSRGVTPRTLVGCRTSTAQTVHLAYGPLASGIQRTLCGLLGELKDAQVAAAAVSCSHCRGLA